jgi:hypothetical protein
LVLHGRLRGDGAECPRRGRLRCEYTVVISGGWLMPRAGRCSCGCRCAGSSATTRSARRGRSPSNPVALTAPRARHTLLRREALTAIAVALAGRAGARLEDRLEHDVHRGLHDPIPNRRVDNALRSPGQADFGMNTRRAGSGRYLRLRRSAANPSRSRTTPYSSTSASVVLSMPGAPSLRRTAIHARHRTSLRRILSRQLGKPRSSHCRRLRPPARPAWPNGDPNGGGPGGGRSGRRPSNALSDAERAQVLEVLRGSRFVDKAPGQVWATMLGEGVYLCSSPPCTGCCAPMVRCASGAGTPATRLGSSPSWWLTGPTSSRRGT